MSIVEIKIPSPGESITEVEIGSWLKADGDYVLIDDELTKYTWMLHYRSKIS